MEKHGKIKHSTVESLPGFPIILSILWAHPKQGVPKAQTT